MKKPDCEQAIRRLVHDWTAETGFETSSGEMPSFYAFRNWLLANGHGSHLEFRSRMGAHYDAEMWFDDELKQNWRN